MPRWGIRLADKYGIFWQHLIEHLMGAIMKFDDEFR
jgi:hypothetical protein